MSEIDKNPQLDEHLWQAWIQKNEARDRVRFARGVRIVVIAAVIALSALLWRLI